MKWTCYEVVPMKVTLGLCYVPFHTNPGGVVQNSGTRKHHEVVSMKFTLGLCYVPFHTNQGGVVENYGTRKHHEVVSMKFTLGLCYVLFHTNHVGVGQNYGTRKLLSRHPFAHRSRPSRIGTRNSDHVFVRIYVYK